MVFHFPKNKFQWLIGIILLLVGGAILLYNNLPIKRIGVTSELIMLGDLNSDNKWDEKDAVILEDFKLKPFSYSAIDAMKIDMNKNDIIDDEDIVFLSELYKYSDPYVTADNFIGGKNITFPRPREFFKYLPSTEYVQRPLFLLDHEIIDSSPLKPLLVGVRREGNDHTYEEQILDEVYNEAIRFSIGFDLRKNNLNKDELEYANSKINYCLSLYKEKDYYNLLLNLIGMVEDVETLTTEDQSQFIKKTLYFRDDLRKLLLSPLYEEFIQGKVDYKKIYLEIEKYIYDEFGLTVGLEDLKPPRDLTSLSNYVDRIEWQYNKTATKNEAFRKILLYAQYDRRYLRSVSKTSQKHSDPELQNHNLPMVLLFRQAMEIQNGDKKAAVGMLDEAIRIPLGWVKSIPKDKLPSSVALENFLLPGNKEDGADKSRHWNVFGGISLYKSPEESFLLALQRENMDLRENNYTSEAMTEFIRDTIANLNGIYYVVSIDPKFAK